MDETIGSLPNETVYVAINTADVEEISKLYMVGPVLARKIVSYREKVGYFQGPDWLANVEGISLNHAFNLSPHINWSVPEKKETFLVRTFVVVMLLMPLAISTWFVYDQFLWVVKFTKYLSGYPITSITSTGWFRAICAYADLSAFITINIWFLHSPIKYILKNEFPTRRFILYVLSFFFLFKIVNGLNHIYYYQFISENGWLAILNNSGWNLLVVLAAISFAVLCLPSALYHIYRPLLLNFLFKYLYLTLVIFGFVVNLIAVFFHLFGLSSYAVPGYVLIFIGIQSFAYISIGLHTLKYSKNIYDFSFIIIPIEVNKKVNYNKWRNWANVNLPDSRQQQELQETLNAMYPRPRFKTVFGFVILGGGGVMLLQTFWAIWQLYVQAWWKSLNIF